MSRQSITFTKNNEAWLANKAAKGDFSSKSEIVNSLIRRERKREAAIRELQIMLKTARASGVAENVSFDAIKAEVLSEKNIDAA